MFEGSEESIIWCFCFFIPHHESLPQCVITIYIYRHIAEISSGFCINLNFCLVHGPTANMEEVYDLYCSQPPGGDRDASASLLGSCIGGHLDVDYSSETCSDSNKPTMTFILWEEGQRHHWLCLVFFPVGTFVGKY